MLDLNVQQCFGTEMVTMFNHKLTLTLVVLIKLFMISKTVKESLMPGHSQKLGSHREPLGVTHTGVLSHPFVFYREFVDTSKPLLMKGVLQDAGHPGLTKWTDEYLKKRFGSKTVKCEPRKIEVRKEKNSWLTLWEFLTLYKSQDIYMVHSLSSDMADLVFIPESLQCGGLQNMIQDSVMWLGSGNTSSLLHRDSLDNLLCLLDGQKDIVLIDKEYKEVVEGHGFEQDGGFSRVDPLAVDMKTFPNFQHVVWHEMKLQKGDCAFIPQHWYHQVNSHGDRHMSVNIWFSRLFWFNKENCSFSKSFYKPLEPLSTFGFASPNEVHRSNLLKRFKKQGIITEGRFHELLPNNPSKQRAHEFFQSINEFSDAVLSWGELYSFDIDKVLMKFPDLFDLLGDPWHDDNDIVDDDDKQTEDLGSWEMARGQKTERDTQSGEEGMSQDTHFDDFDDFVPLPDAMSDDDFPLPDDPVGQNVGYGGDIVNNGADYGKDEGRKDEL